MPESLCQRITTQTYLDGLFIFNVESFRNHRLGPPSTAPKVGTDANTTISAMSWTFEHRKSGATEHTFFPLIKGKHNGWCISISRRARLPFSAKAECFDRIIVGIAGVVD
jgi:hypothetical protein